MHPFGSLPGVDVRDSASPVLASAARRWLARINARHPWNHNEHFHGWILRNLPVRRRAALDVGCGTGMLAGKLALNWPICMPIDGCGIGDRFTDRQELARSQLTTPLIGAGRMEMMVTPGGRRGVGAFRSRAGTAAG